MKKEQILKVYYDGLCVLCSREIDHYKKQDGADSIEFIDICGNDFDAQKEGVDPFAVHKIMHAKRPDGSIAKRVQAFIEIWNRLPRYRWLSKIARKNGVNQFLEFGYSVFAQVRPLLPRQAKKDDCSNSPYCEVHRG